MKNQYVGDIGDFGKYGLLSFLAKKGISIGVNWYLTDKDDTNDGKFTDYLKDDYKIDYSHYDEILFNKLKRIVNKGRNNKRVQDIENENIIQNAVYFNKALDRVSTIKNRNERIYKRTNWHNKAKTVLLLKNVNLVFADPDNGSAEGVSSRKNGEKYAELSELRDYYDEGKNVVYYCHKARRKENKWKEKYNEFNNDGKHNAKIIVLTFHRGTQRSYIFAIHPEDYNKYDKLINKFLKTSWGLTDEKKTPMFTREQ